MNGLVDTAPQASDALSHTTSLKSFSICFMNEKLRHREDEQLSKIARLASNNAEHVAPSDFRVYASNSIFPSPKRRVKGVWLMRHHPSLRSYAIDPIGS